MNAQRITDIALGFDGLTEEQVLRSRERHGENKLIRKKRKSFARKFAESFGDPIIKILLIALGVNVLFLFRHVDWLESAGIALAILLATLVSTISEYGSESAFEKLRAEAARIDVRVRRGGALAEIPVEELVVGDIVRLQSGDRIAADGVLVAGRLEADQSALNGEAKEALKLAEPDASLRADLLDKSSLFSGTVVVAGEGLMRVCLVGGATFYGRLAEEVQRETRESPLKVRLAGLAGTISRFGYIAAGLVAFAYFFNLLLVDTGFNFAAMLALFSEPGWLPAHLLQAVTLAVTVVVMAVPEGLPMMINVVLSANMKKMLKDNVLVRKLVGIETAGSLNILFTDKTGTLTKGKLNVARAVMGYGASFSSARELSLLRPLWDLIHDSIFYNTGAELVNGAAIGGNATDRALLEYIARYPGGKRLRVTEAVPFSSEFKYMATRVAGERGVTLVKGAPEVLLPHCSAYYDEFGRAQPLFDASGIELALNELAADAMRVILLATAEKRVGAGGALPPLKFVALMGVRDETRGEARDGVLEVKGAGVQVVMITGDAKPTAEAVARETGIMDAGGAALTSAELNALGDDAVIALLPRLRVVARALPSDKSRLVKLAQRRGLVVGMTGDGINDAPALKQSDVGFAMGSGTEVAKEAGDIVILDDNIGSIARAVRYGRTIFKSIRKFIIFQLTVNMCAVGVAVIAPLIGVDTPLTVIQMLWINMVMDTLGGVAFGGEPALKSYMLEPPKRRDEPIINGYMWGEIFFLGAYTVAVCLAFLSMRGLRLFLLGTDEIGVVMTAFFALFIFIGIFNSFCARTHLPNLFSHLALNKTFVIVMGGVAVVQLAMIYFGGTVFRTSGLPPLALLRVALLAFTVVPAELLHRLARGRAGGC